MVAQEWEFFFCSEIFSFETAQIATILILKYCCFPRFTPKSLSNVPLLAEREKKTKNKKKEAKPISSQSRWACCFGNVLHHWGWITSLRRERARWRRPRFSTRSTQHFSANGFITLRLIRMLLLLIRPIISFNSLDDADSLLLVAVTEPHETRRVGGFKAWTCLSHCSARLSKLPVGFSHCSCVEIWECQKENAGPIKMTLAGRWRQIKNKIHGVKFEPRGLWRWTLPPPLISALTLFNATV